MYRDAGEAFGAMRDAERVGGGDVAASREEQDLVDRAVVESV